MNYFDQMTHGEILLESTLRFGYPRSKSKPKFDQFNYLRGINHRCPYHDATHQCLYDLACFTDYADFYANYGKGY